GADLDAKLPLLATYLGHQHLSGTQRYLHLTAEIFPEITARSQAAFGDVIPRGNPTMKPTDFSIHVTTFLTHYLAAQRNLSANTIKAYRDVFTLLLRFCR